MGGALGALRVLVAILAVGGSAALGVTAPAAAAAGGRTALVVTVWEDGREPETKVVRTLRCEPTGGTHPWRTRTCAVLARGGFALFRPTPPDTACTEVFGGHQTALVRGVVDGHRVWARFSRVDGCAIARWQRVAPLLPTAWTG